MLSNKLIYTCCNVCQKVLESAALRCMTCKNHLCGDCDDVLHCRQPFHHRYLVNKKIFQPLKPYEFWDKDWKSVLKDICVPCFVPTQCVKCSGKGNMKLIPNPDPNLQIADVMHQGRFDLRAARFLCMDCREITDADKNDYIFSGFWSARATTSISYLFCEELFAMWYHLRHKSPLNSEKMFIITIEEISKQSGRSPIVKIKNMSTVYPPCGKSPVMGSSDGNVQLKRHASAGKHPRRSTENLLQNKKSNSLRLQRDHEESGEDFPYSDEQVAIPNTSHQEPEGERSGFPVERPEDPDPTNLVAKGHPIDISLSGQPADNGVEETNVSSEIFDGDSRGETHHTGEEDEENGTAGVRTNGNFHDICEAVSDLPLRTDLQHHRLKETNSNENKIVCAIFPNVRITGSDVRQLTSHLFLELKEFSFHLEHLLLTHQQTFLEEIHSLVLYLKNLQLLTQLEPLTPEIKSLLTKLDHFPAVIRPNNVQLAENIKQTLIQTKTNLRQL
ncbi:Uncharacterized protein APZ42_013853 [Daphnia magna]|uniref:CxC3 like cysteine cluster domain-containing protein n=1 Tax=Daphnia magna TaxID=35525 RepID=A0A162QH64_9CRUS|nr:Uncharacterized protein APZ42_013853 [Daphnia magna]